MRQAKAAKAIAAVRAGDTEAFGEFVELFKAPIMSLCLSLMRNAADAEELAQDVFVRAYRYLDTFDLRRPCFPWLAKISYRLAQTRWRQRQREAEAQQDAREEIGFDRQERDPLDSLVADEQARRLWRAVRSLPGQQRAVTVLYYQQGLEVREVARVLGVTSGTVKTLLFRARRGLQSVLGQDDEHRDGS
ncbi:MAG: RNA polymerase sigma factor [Phycisphaerae bacterium]|nr:RNA polymerase sigma factor [Phycisphaerae bacterium]